MGWAKDLVIEENSTIERHSKVGAEVSYGVNLTLILGNQDNIVIFFADLKNTLISIMKLRRKLHLYLLGAFSFSLW